MTPCFADTAYYLVLLSPRDVLHQSATEASHQATRSVVTSAWVVQELADGLAAPNTRSAFIRLFDSLTKDPNLAIVDFDSDIWHRAFELYRGRPDKGWSLTDCTSFVIMRDRGIQDALTIDRHFEQAGFTILLRRTR